MRGTLEFTTGELFYLLCGRLALHSSVAQLSRIEHLLQITLLLASCLSHGEHCNYQLLAIISHLSFRIFWCHHLHGHAVNNWFIAYFSCLIGALYTNESSEAWKISRLMFLIWGWKFSVLMILLILCVTQGRGSPDHHERSWFPSYASFHHHIQVCAGESCRSFYWNSQVNNLNITRFMSHFVCGIQNK